MQSVLSGVKKKESSFLSLHLYAVKENIDGISGKCSDLAF